MTERIRIEDLPDDLYDLFMGVGDSLAMLMEPLYEHHTAESLSAAITSLIGELCWALSMLDDEGIAAAMEQLPGIMQNNLKTIAQNLSSEED